MCMKQKIKFWELQLYHHVIADDRGHLCPYQSCELIHELNQVLCDILRSGGFPGQENGHQPPLYFAADDLEYQVGNYDSIKMWAEKLNPEFGDIKKQATICLFA